MKPLTLVYIGKDQRDTDAFYIGDVDRDRVDLLGISNTAGLPLAAIANEILSKCETPVFGLCHADAIFKAGALGAFWREGLVSVCGIVGRHWDGDYVSASGQRLGLGISGLPVSTLDGMAVFLPRLSGLRFDAETFDGFHCHVEDLCLQAHARGIPVTVPAADAHHRNHTQGPGWLMQYGHYRRKLAEKWKGTEFATT